MSNKNAIFGYGSLIIPLSFAGRYTDYGNIDEKYDQEKTLRDFHDRTKAVNAWEKLKEKGVEMHPVQLKGYKRYYSIKHRGGGMLEVYPDNETHNPQEQGVINGMLYTNIPDDVYEVISSSEGKYDQAEIHLTDFDYIDTTPDEDQLDQTTTMYTSSPGPRNTDILKHEIYHEGLLRGFVYLYRDEDLITEEIAEQLLEEYLKYTYEYTPDTESWKTLFEKDGHKDIQRVKQVLEEELELY